MFDVTSTLMGDPGSTSRRPPTAAEIERQGRLLGARAERHRLYKPRSRSGPRPPSDLRLLTLAVGQALDGLTRVEAETARAWLKRNDKHCAVRVQPNGRYRLQRIR